MDVCEAAAGARTRGMLQFEASVQTCRVCLEIGDEGPVGEVLISPCAGCRGTSAYIHFSCMAGFYRSRARWWDLSCPTCRHDYEGKSAVDLGHIGLCELERAHGLDHPSVAVILTNLGNAYGDLGDAAKKRDLLERALSIKEQEYGPDHRELGITLTNLGNAYGALGDATRKRDLLERALAIMEREFGSDHRDVAITLTNLGNAYGDLGDATRKRDVLERALLIKESEYGPDHREVGITLTNLGNAYGDLGEPAQQRKLLERALIIDEREYGRDHVLVAITLTNLGNAHGRLGNTRRQKELLLRTLAVFEREYDPGHVYCAMTSVFLSEAHGALREFHLARSAASSALCAARASLPRPNAIVADLSLSVALVRRASDDAAARATWEEATAELRAAVGEEVARAKVGTFATRAAVFWRSAGRPDVAEWLAELTAA